MRLHEVSWEELEKEWPLESSYRLCEIHHCTRVTVNYAPRCPKCQGGKSEESRMWTRWYHAQQYRLNPIFRLKMLLRARMQAAFKGYVSNTTKALLGCSLNQLKIHLESLFESDMNWNNHGTVWHLDHYIPLATLDLNNPADLMLACHWTNLQPLYKQDNLDKRDNWEYSEKLEERIKEWRT